MEVDPNPSSVKTYQVEGVPALRLIASQELKASVEGVMGKEKLLGWLDENLNN